MGVKCFFFTNFCSYFSVLCYHCLFQYCCLIGYFYHGLSFSVFLLKFVTKLSQLLWYSDRLRHRLLLFLFILCQMRICVQCHRRRSVSKVLAHNLHISPGRISKACTMYAEPCGDKNSQSFLYGFLLRPCCAAPQSFLSVPGIPAHSIHSRMYSQTESRISAPRIFPESST